MHHDPLLSTRKTAITNWGHCWVILGVICKLPFCGDRFFCLPILFRLYVPKKTADKKRLPYYTKPQLAVQMLRLLCGRLENRQFHAIGDSTYGGKSVLCKLPVNCGLTSRLKMDARLYDAPPPRTKSRKGGRPRKRGRRLPTPQAMLAAGRCRHLTLDIYGRRDKSRVAECVAQCYAAPDRPLKIVAVQPLVGGRKHQAFFSTCADDTAAAVLTRYAARWSLEVTNHDAKGQLGFEEPQGWSRRGQSSELHRRQCCCTRWWCCGSAVKGIVTTCLRRDRGTSARPLRPSRTCSRHCVVRPSKARFCRCTCTAVVAEMFSSA